MTPYVSCEHARELLEGFLDGELAVDDQVAVEAHLRWCRTCTAHVDDLRLIGASVRDMPATAVTRDDGYALASMQASVLARVRAERDQAFLTRVRTSFSDTRLLFPALGATMALMVCFVLTYSVQVTASSELTEMLIARTRPRVIGDAQAPYSSFMLESSADPGSDQNPLRLDDAFATPQLLDRDLAMSELDGIDEASFAVATVVSRKGRIETYELLRGYSDGQSTAAADSVLNAVRQSRFSPAQDHGGGPVAAYMVWFIAKTTVVTTRIAAKPAAPVVRARPVAPVLAAPPALDELAPIDQGRLDHALNSTVA